MTPIKAAADPSREELLALADAGLRHADGLEAKLALPDWKPGRSHIEQSRNSIRKLAEALRLAAAPAGNAGVREAAQAVIDLLVWDETDEADEKVPHILHSGSSFNDALSELRIALAAQPREAGPVTPITNPLVLPAGIKAGDYASRSPIPEAPGGREAQGALTKLAAECHRAKWQFDLSEDYRPTAKVARGLIAMAFRELHRIGDIALKMRDEARALKPQDGGNCEHGIAKVNCGICVPSEVFSGGSGR